MNILILIIFGLIPSFVWLLFYLRKDAHPESRLMILKIFLYGMLSALPTIYIEIGFREEITALHLPPFLFAILYWFVGVALVEELIKYLIVRDKVLNNKEFDEPIDAMLYMVVAALGFAASENILVFLSPDVFSYQLDGAMNLLGFRFITATFLHTLSSGLIGFFIALGLYETKKRARMFFTGIIIAAILHGIYNFAIMEIGGGMGLLIPAAILVSLAIFVFVGFEELKKIKSVCKTQ